MMIYVIGTVKERANRKSLTVVPQQMLDVYISNRSSTFAMRNCLVLSKRGRVEVYLRRISNLPISI